MSNLQPESNPFAPPSADIESVGAIRPITADEAELATRWQRLGAATVDGLIFWVALIPVIVGIGFASYQQRAAAGESVGQMIATAGGLGLVGGLLLLAFVVLNAYLLTTRGQSVGKIVAGTRVVMVDGARAPFVRVVPLRWMLFMFMGWIPGLSKVAVLVSLIDMLMIFRRNRRCLHDVVAGTKVVRVTAGG